MMLVWEGFLKEMTLGLTSITHVLSSFAALWLLNFDLAFSVFSTVR